MTFRFSRVMSLAAATLLMLNAVSSQAEAVRGSAENLLEKDLLPGIVSLDRTVRIYHYYRLPHLYPQLESPEGRRGEIQRYIEAVTERFWDLGFDARDYVNAGPGLYLATDPYISRSFGYKDQDRPEQLSAMLELTVPVGTRMLRVVNVPRSESRSKKVEPRLRLSPETVSALIQQGIVPQDFVAKLFQDKSFIGPIFFRDSLARMTQPELVEFRKMVMRILVKHDVQMIEYNWQSALAGFCRKHNYSSLNFIGRPKLIGNDDWVAKAVLITDPELPNLSKEESDVRQRVAKLKGVLSQAEALVAAKKNTRGLIQSSYSESEFQQIKAHTFMCE
jgi:hypothetical protein